MNALDVHQSEPHRSQQEGPFLLGPPPILAMWSGQSACNIVIIENDVISITGTPTQLAQLPHLLVKEDASVLSLGFCPNPSFKSSLPNLL